MNYHTNTGTGVSEPVVSREKTINEVLSRHDVEITGPVTDDYAAILTPEAVAFVATLAGQFEGRRADLLQKRKERQEKLDAGQMPDFLSETAEIRESKWKVAPHPADLDDRRVEITGPVDRKMIINALNSGAKVFMADFEDSLAPTWHNVIQGQFNLRDAVNRTITLSVPGGKSYALNDKIATLLVRPRGWHLGEKNILFNSQPISASLLDFGLYFFHNAKASLSNGTGPYFYLPKLENHHEARLWNDVFITAQDLLGLPRGTIKATVLIEHILAAFEMDEILYELKDHSTGLNCGRWDYIFSFIKKFRSRPDFLIPDRAVVTMNRHFLQSYVDLLVQTCHRRGAHAMGGMAAQIPIKNDPEANEVALSKVQADKEREVKAGHDGTWVAHPGLVSVASESFDRGMSGANQLDVLRSDVNISAVDLLRVPKGEITEKGLRTNISIGIQYMAAWVNGNGCVPLDNLMEDAATAEISRTQVWQWVHHPKGALSDGRDVTFDLYRNVKSEEMARIEDTVGEEQFESGGYRLASQLFDEIIANEELEEFLTLRAYKHLD
ncbi:MAG: malate synthase A [Candidatus Marinimicrobia bacterium]|nr:malate synthase A [Candidatus Neomarinimicrobiota bacterium]MDP6593887.1 malate synthase A [Candidatus Neomarinimicrobiota bacterium]